MGKRLSTIPILTALLAGGMLFAVEYDAREMSVMRASEQKLAGMRETLGLDARHSFKAISTLTCTLNQDHTRLDQYFQGVRVWNAQVIDHTNQDADRGELPLTNDTLTDININVEPTLTQKEALGVVEANRPTRDAYTSEPTVELVVYPIFVQSLKPGASAEQPTNACDIDWNVQEYRLAYYVHTESEGETEECSTVDHWDFMVDAHTGLILHKWDSLYTAREKGRGRSQYNGEVSIETTKTGGRYEMKDPVRGKGHKFGANAITNADNSESKTNPGKVFTDDDNNWGDGKNYKSGQGSSDGVTGQTAAVDAMYALQASWDFMKNILKRDGMDGKGTATYCRVHVGKNYDNAYWMPATGAMSFGDGSKTFRNLACIDVLGHELSHGVCTSTAGLANDGEAGGLSEGNADIGGTMIEFYAKGGGLQSQSSTIPETGGDWGVGTEIMISGKGLRYLDKPSKDGKNDDAYTPEIGKKNCHHSAGPMGRFFYFLSQGATTSGDTSAPKYLPKGMKGLGNDKAFKIWFRGMSTGLTKGSNYAKAREAAIRAAQDLYGKNSAEDAAVQNAWGGVNVGKPYPGQSPAPSEPSDPDNPTPKPPSPKPPKPKPPQPKPPTPKPPSPKPPSPKPPSPKPPTPKPPTPKPPTPKPPTPKPPTPKPPSPKPPTPKPPTPKPPSPKPPAPKPPSPKPPKPKPPTPKPPTPPDDIV